MIVIGFCFKKIKVMITIIVAVAENGAIGCHNKLLWHIGDDLKRFKALTTGHTILMGRKTYESIGRPLPKRRNIVISRNLELSIEGVEVVGSVEAAIEMCGSDSEIFVIGGAQIYSQTLALADKLYLTKVYQSPQGDVFFPEIDANEWVEVACDRREGYDFIDYIRR